MTDDVFDALMSDDDEDYVVPSDSTSIDGSGGSTSVGDYDSSNVGGEVSADGVVVDDGGSNGLNTVGERGSSESSISTLGVGVGSSGGFKFRPISLPSASGDSRSSGSADVSPVVRDEVSSSSSGGSGSFDSDSVNGGGEADDSSGGSYIDVVSPVSPSSTVDDAVVFGGEGSVSSSVGGSDETSSSSSSRFGISGGSRSSAVVGNPFVPYGSGSFDEFVDEDEFVEDVSDSEFFDSIDEFVSEEDFNPFVDDDEFDGDVSGEVFTGFSGRGYGSGIIGDDSSIGDESVIESGSSDGSVEGEGVVVEEDFDVVFNDDSVSPVVSDSSSITVEKGDTDSSLSSTSVAVDDSVGSLSSVVSPSSPVGDFNPFVDVEDEEVEVGEWRHVGSSDSSIDSDSSVGDELKGDSPSSVSAGLLADVVGVASDDSVLDEGFVAHSEDVWRVRSAQDSARRGGSSDSVDDGVSTVGGNGVSGGSGSVGDAGSGRGVKAKGSKKSKKSGKRVGVAREFRKHPVREVDVDDSGRLVGSPSSDDSLSEGSGVGSRYSYLSSDRRLNVAELEFFRNLGASKAAVLGDDDLVAKLRVGASGQGERGDRAVRAVERAARGRGGLKRGAKASFNERDRETLQFLAMFRYATDGQLARMFGLAVSTTYNRLKKLRGMGLVIDRDIYGARPVWFLTDAGMLLSGFDLPRTTESKLNFKMFPHQFTVNHTAANLWGGNVNVLNLDEFPVRNRRDASGVPVFGEELVSELELQSAFSKLRTDQKADSFRSLLMGEFDSAFAKWERSGRVGVSPEQVLGNEHMWVLMPPHNVRLAYHVPDLVVKRPRNADGTPESIAVEVEISNKAGDAYERTLKAYRADKRLYKKVIWVCKSVGPARKLEQLSKELGLWQEGRIDIVPVLTEDGVYKERDLWMI